MLEIAEEKQFEKNVRLWLKVTFGDTQWHFKVFGNAFQESGIADLLGCLNGRAIWLEMKAIKGKESALQAYKRGLFEKAGGYARVVSPKNWDVVKEELIRISKGEWVE